MKVVITGSSGLLGRELLKAVKTIPSCEVTGTAFSRAGDGLIKVDLTDNSSIQSMFAELKPDIVVHAAAERRPDVCEVGAVWTIASEARKCGAYLIYISTDYVFDGSAAPYAETAPVHPINKYGRSKARGEYACLAAHPGAAVLRVPVLYGPSLTLAESAITVLAKGVLDADNAASVDHWAARYPTFTPDLGQVVRQWVELFHREKDAAVAAGSGADGFVTGEFGQGLSGLFHWSGADRATKYEISCLMGRILGRSTDHLSPNPDPPAGAPRPQDCHLSSDRLAGLGITGLHTPLETGLQTVLGPLCSA